MNEEWRVIPGFPNYSFSNLKRLKGRLSSGTSIISTDVPYLFDKDNNRHCFRRDSEEFNELWETTWPDLVDTLDKVDTLDTDDTLDENDEEFRDIPGFEDRYRISNHGRVLSLNYNNTGVPGLLQAQTGHVILCKDKVRKQCKITDLMRSVWPEMEIPNEYVISNIPEDYFLETNDNGIDGRNKSVICLTTKKIFKSIKEGSRYYNTDSAHVGKCCQGKYKFSGKLSDGTPLVWRYLNYSHGKTYRIKGECNLNKYELRTINSIRNLVNNGKLKLLEDKKRVLNRLKKEAQELDRLIHLLENDIKEDEYNKALEIQLLNLITNGTVDEKLKAMEEYTKFIQKKL